MSSKQCRISSDKLRVLKLIYAMNSKTDPMNLSGKMCAFTDLLPNGINVYTALREGIEVRLKFVATFTRMHSLVRTFWRELNYSSS